MPGVGGRGGGGREGGDAMNYHSKERGEVSCVGGGVGGLGCNGRSGLGFHLYPRRTKGEVWMEYSGDVGYTVVARVIHCHSCKFVSTCSVPLQQLLLLLPPLSGLIIPPCG